MHIFIRFYWWNMEGFDAFKLSFIMFCSKCSSWTHLRNFSLWNIQCDFYCGSNRSVVLWRTFWTFRFSLGKINLAFYLSFWTAKLVFVTQTTLSLNCRKQPKKQQKKRVNEAQAVKRAEKQYIKCCLIAVVHCLVFCTLPADKKRSAAEKKSTR